MVGLQDAISSVTLTVVSLDGKMLDITVGIIVGNELGKVDDTLLGEIDGFNDSMKVGDILVGQTELGKIVGETERIFDGDNVGRRVGTGEYFREGNKVDSSVGTVEGLDDALLVGM